NAFRAPSVPFRARGASVSSDRTYSNDAVAPLGVAVNALRRPPGERPALSIPTVFSGDATLNVTTGCRGGTSRKWIKDSSNAAAAKTEAVATQSLGAVFPGRGAGTASDGPAR